MEWLLGGSSLAGITQEVTLADNHNFFQPCKLEVVKCNDPL